MLKILAGLVFILFFLLLKANIRNLKKIVASAGETSVHNLVIVLYGTVADRVAFRMSVLFSIWAA